MTICLEPVEPCIINWDILKDVRLPKVGCDWNTDFSGIYFNDLTLQNTLL